MASAERVNAVEASVARIASDLARSGRRWAVVGGLAVSARTEPRMTRDVDVAVAVRDDREAEIVTRALLRSGYSVHAAIEHLDTGRLATMRLLPPLDPESIAVIDVLFATAGIEPEIAARATTVEVLPSMGLPVAAVGDLIAMKLLSRDDDRRPHDAVDLRALCLAADDGDLAVAREAVELITSRGCHRGRDLAAALDVALARYRV